MSIYSAIEMGASALAAQAIGLQVAGQNIANVNTPGYVREQVIFAPTAPEQLGELVLGTGVEVEAIVQKIDLFLAERVRNAAGDLSSAEAQRDAFLRLETLIAELTDQDLSTGLNEFFSAIQDVINQPESLAMRQLAVQEGGELAASIRTFRSRIDQSRDQLDERIETLVDEANRLVDEIADLNLQIVVLEEGGENPSQAGALRSRRLQALDELSKLIDFTASEQESGSVSVILPDGHFLVIDSEVQHLGTTTTIDRELQVRQLIIEADQSQLTPTGGELGGLLAGRDDILGGFIDQLDQLTGGLIFEFNRVFSSGQGLEGYSDVTGTYEVVDAAVALNQAGLDFTPENGSFQVRVTNRSTGLTETTDIFVDLNGVGAETTLNDLVASLDAVDGISAQLTSDNRLEIQADSADLEFMFAGDTSGALAALGVNTFFTGSDSKFVDVNGLVEAEPALFAASQNGEVGDTSNAQLLIDLLTGPLDSLQGRSLDEFYESIVTSTAQGSASTQAVTEGFRDFHETLRSQLLQTSGVNLDEEVVQMMAFQRAYQAIARYISTLSELLEEMTNL